MASCNVCTKKVLRHSYQLKCHVCTKSIHLKCIPFLDKNDSVYTERENNKWICPKCTENIFPFNHFHENQEFIFALADSWSIETAQLLDLFVKEDRIFLFILA